MKQVSWHLLQVFDTLAADGWLTARDVSRKTGIAPRTARAHLRTLAENGVAQRQIVFDGYRYRLAAVPNPDVLRALENARAVLKPDSTE